jgi:hypothetical protein
VDTANNLVFIADTTNNAIRVVNRTTNIITTFAGKLNSLGRTGDGKTQTS